MDTLFLCSAALLLLVQICLGAEETTDVNTPVMCGDLGPFFTSGEKSEYQNIVYRSRNALVNCSIIPYVHYRLYTRRDKEQDVSTSLDHKNPATIRASTFDPNKKTVFLMHGYMDHYNRDIGVGGFWPDIRRKILSVEDWNVIHIDWHAGSSMCTYTQACANLRLVGALNAQFINHLITVHGLKPENVYIVGHSLGAHGAGYTGANLQLKYNTTIGRITGLDPAGPFFTGLDGSARLDPTDAKSVDTLVTNIHVFGSRMPMGHVNFFSHGGKAQPKCSDLGVKEFSTIAARLGVLALNESDQSGSSAAGLVGFPTLDILGCSHNHAVYLFYQTILPTSEICKFKPTPCDRSAPLSDGPCSECKKVCPGAGFRADDLSNSASNVPLTQKNFYVDTTVLHRDCREYNFTAEILAVPAKTDPYPNGGKITVELYAVPKQSERVSIAYLSKNDSVVVGKVARFRKFALLEKNELSALEFEFTAPDGNCLSKATLNLTTSIASVTRGDEYCSIKRKFNLERGKNTVIVTKEFHPVVYEFVGTGLVV